MRIHSGTRLEDRSEIHQGTEIARLTAENESLRQQLVDALNKNADRQLRQENHQLREKIADLKKGINEVVTMMEEAGIGK